MLFQNTCPSDDAKHWWSSAIEDFLCNPKTGTMDRGNEGSIVLLRVTRYCESQLHSYAELDTSQ